MKFVHIEVTARLRALVSVDSVRPVDSSSLLAALPLSSPALFHFAEVLSEHPARVEQAEATDFQAGVHEFKVVFMQEFGHADPCAPLRVEVIARSRAEAFALMKSAEQQAVFSKVEVQNLQGGVEARMVQDRAGFGVVDASTGKLVVSRLSLTDARSRFAAELVKPHKAGLQLVDLRGGSKVILASAS